jgi:hypothetical protein
VTATLANTGVTKVYDGSAGTTAVASYTVLGQLGTDTVNVSTGSLAYNTSHVVGSDHLVASGLTVGGVTGSTFTSASLASDYALSSATVTSAPGSAAITPAPLTVRANDASRPVSQPNPPFSASYSGLRRPRSPAASSLPRSRMRARPPATTSSRRRASRRRTTRSSSSMARCASSAPRR